MTSLKSLSILHIVKNRASAIELTRRIILCIHQRDLVNTSRKTQSLNSNPSSTTFGADELSWIVSKCLICLAKIAVTLEDFEDIGFQNDGVGRREG